MATIMHRTPPETDGRDARGVADLLKELKDETATLISQEIALAKAELGRKIAKLLRNAVYLVLGGVLAYLAIISLTFAAAMGVGAGLQLAGMTPLASIWLGPFIVAVVLGSVGVVLAMSALRRMRNEGLAPQRTIKSLKENKQWIEQKVA
jgi:uncharacterized membrane protein YqjE